jgi:hypothetical protein
MAETELVKSFSKQIDGTRSYTYFQQNNEHVDIPKNSMKVLQIVLY